MRPRRELQPPDDEPRALILHEHIFREYDIRGVVGEELNAEVAEAIGRAYASELRERSGHVSPSQGLLLLRKAFGVLNVKGGVPYVLFRFIQGFTKPKIETLPMQYFLPGEVAAYQDIYSSVFSG